MKDYRFLDFIRNVGKHITVNYMMAKENVKRRISGEVGEGLSFAEFSYQLVQANDFCIYIKILIASYKWVAATNGEI